MQLQSVNQPLTFLIDVLARTNIQVTVSASRDDADLYVLKYLEERQTLQYFFSDHSQRRFSQIVRIQSSRKYDGLLLK